MKSTTTGNPKASKNKDKDTTTPDAGAANQASTPIPTCAAIESMPVPERIALYKQCDEQMRSRFLIQGKVIHTLKNGEEDLRKAGVPSSSLSNARMAYIAFTLIRHRHEGAGVQIHTGGKKPVPFTEDVYDTLTLEQCRLLSSAFTSRGNVTHRPPAEQTLAILKMPDWDRELDCYFEHGMIRSMKTAAEKEAKNRAKQLQEKTITDIPPMPDAGPTSEAPQAPVIVSVPPPKPAADTPTPDAEVETGGESSPESESAAPSAAPVPLNVVPFAAAVASGPTAPVGYTAEALTLEVEALKTMIADLAPDVTSTDCDAVALMLRELAAKLDAEAKHRSPAPTPVAAQPTPKPAGKTAKRKEAAA